MKKPARVNRAWPSRGAASAGAARLAAEAPGGVPGAAGRGQTGSDTLPGRIALAPQQARCRKWRLFPGLAVMALVAAFQPFGQREAIAPPGAGLGLPLSPAIQAGDFVYLSGSLANLPGTREIEGDIESGGPAAGFYAFRSFLRYVYLDDLELLCVQSDSFGKLDVDRAG